MVDDILDKLSALCASLSADPLEGRKILAKRAGLSEQYLYQVLAGKPLGNGNPRSLGRVARGKISRAFPGWLHAQTDAAAPNLAEPRVSAYAVKRHRSRVLVQKVCDLSEQISDDGLHELIGFARCLISTHPFVKPKAA